MSDVEAMSRAPQPATPELEPARAHPPTSPETNDSKRIWPSAIGVTVLVLQVLGLIVSVVYAAALFMDFSAMLGPILGKSALEAQDRWQGHMLASYGSAALLSLVAIAGAILLMRRRRSGVALLVAWSVLRVPYALFSAWVTASVQGETAATMPMPARTPPGFASIMFGTTFATALIFALALPLFLMVWFAVPPIRRQTRSWN